MTELTDFRLAAQVFMEAIPVGELREHPGNANTGDVGAISESIDAHGFYGAVLVQKSSGFILAGNHRYRIAVAKGATSLPGFILDCDDDEASRLLAVDNRTTHLATTDEEALLALLIPLAQTPRGLAGTGYVGDDLDALIAAMGDGRGGGPGLNGDPDDVPEPPAEPVSVRGDLLLLGPNRLLCGDATNPDDLKRVTEGMGTVGIVYTDPPYGVDIVSSAGKVGAAVGYPFGGAKNGKQGSKGTVRTTAYRPVAGDDNTDVAADAFRLLSSEYPGALHVWWGGNHYAASAGLSNSSCWLVWDKDTNGNFADAELAWTNHPGAVRLLQHMWNGMLRASEHGKRVHPTQKPVALAEWAFNVIDPKDERTLVLDTFAGSGSTLIAAHNTGRTAALIETEPAYVDVIAARWERATSIKPERVLPDGTTEPVTFQDQP